MDQLLEHSSEITLTNPVFVEYEDSLGFSQKRTAGSRNPFTLPGRGIFMLPFQLAYAYSS